MVKQGLLEIRETLSLVAPFIASFLRKVRIEACRSIPLVAVNKQYVLLINPERVRGTSLPELSTLLPLLTPLTPGKF